MLDVLDGGDLGFGVFVGGEVALLVEEEVLVAVLGEADARVLFGGGFLGLLGVHEECYDEETIWSFDFK